MRLVDADALKLAVDDEWCPDMMVSEIWDVIDRAPTVPGWISQSEHDFFDWLACSVVLADDFETNPGFYREIICRKLVRIGMLNLEGDRYVLPNPKEWRGEDERNAD